MFKTYIKIGWRNLLKNRGYSFINIGGLALAMAVVMLISLWMQDELTYDTIHPDHDRIAQVMHHELANGQIKTAHSQPAVLAAALREAHGHDFKYVILASWTDPYTLTYGDRIAAHTAAYIEPQVTHLLGLNMLRGSRDGLKNMNTVLLSASVAAAYFGHDDPIGKTMRVDNRADVQVAGVYEDLPDNSSFHDLTFILPWDLYLSQNPWITTMQNPWGSNFVRIFVQVADGADMQQVSARIGDVMLHHASGELKRSAPRVFLHPMDRWHLYAEFKAGVNTGGGIDTVWLFGLIGVFVLLLACINFMNLSTARSEKRSREVGIRKSIGSARSQLITQFFSESVMISILAFIVALLLIELILAPFNDIAGKRLNLLKAGPVFWLGGIGFSVLTGLFAGLYPALYLSSFQPVKVLKGAVHPGRLAAMPRKVLVVVQFTISITLVIGTLVVYRQIGHAQNRPIGYHRDGLVSLSLNPERHRHFEAIRAELKNAGVITEMALSGNPVTDIWSQYDGFDWEGKDPDLAVEFPNNSVTAEYGQTLGWTIKEGRDFSRDLATDAHAFILNEAAVKFIGWKDPVGKIIRWRNEPYTVIGVVKDLLVQSPYSAVQPSLFRFSDRNLNIAVLRLNPAADVQHAMATVEQVFKKYNPESPFDATFVDDEFAWKFGNEKRIGTLAAFFATLAVIISCLGLFGMASFVAEQRTKEIGIRKVLGATVASVWQMLSKDFVMLVLLSCLIATPLAYYYLSHWLLSYEYRTGISWWIMAAACIGALVITLATVSLQAIKAAVKNPVKSLRSE